MRQPHTDTHEIGTRYSNDAQKIWRNKINLLQLMLLCVGVIWLLCLRWRRIPIWKQFLVCDCAVVRCMQFLCNIFILYNNNIILSHFCDFLHVSSVLFNHNTTKLSSSHKKNRDQICWRYVTRFAHLHLISYSLLYYYII